MLYDEDFEHDHVIPRAEEKALEREIESLRKQAGVKCRLGEGDCFPERTWHPRVIRNMEKYWEYQVDCGFPTEWSQCKDSQILKAFEKTKNDAGCYCPRSRSRSK